MNVTDFASNSCSICAEVYEKSTGHDAVRLDCQHTFGRRCIKKIALRSALCPECGLGAIPAELSERPTHRTILPRNPAAIGCLIMLWFAVANYTFLLLEAIMDHIRP